MEYAIELKGISKRFGNLFANKNVNLQLKKGEILALLGENGSGKTTLMNMLSGIYMPDTFICPTAVLLLWTAKKCPSARPKIRRSSE